MNSKHYHETILLAGSGIYILSILLFSIHLTQQQQYTLALLHWLLIGVMSVTTFYARHPCQTKIPALSLSTLSLASSVSMVHIYGPQAAFWLYPAVILSFSLLDVRLASMFTFIAMLLTFPALSPALPLADIYMIYSSLMALSFFGYIISILTTQQRETLTKLVSIDELTGTWNRRALDTSLMQSLGKFHHYNNRPALSLLMLDLDHFKQVNDTFGHMVGDNVLRQLASLIHANIRPSEHLYRYGGEEFVIIAHGSTLAVAQKIAEKLRHEIEQTLFHDVGHITVSIGVAELSHGQTPKHLLDIADQALYQAKRLGRNQICCQNMGNQSPLSR